MSPRAVGAWHWRASVPTSRWGVALEGECPHEPPSAARKGGLWSPRGAPGGASVCLPADEQTLVPPILRSEKNFVPFVPLYEIELGSALKGETTC
jgi:hypothetical protein